MEAWAYLLPEAVGGERVVAVGLGADTRLQMIALADIARIVADAFARPEAFIGKKLEIAGDELTVRQIADVFSRIDGVPTRFERQSAEELRAWSENAAELFAWLDTKGFQADIAALT
jgi:uncharacterized protein YbjT (DUF2867 family)